MSPVSLGTSAAGACGHSCVRPGPKGQARLSRQLAGSAYGRFLNTLCNVAALTCLNKTGNRLLCMVCMQQSRFLGALCGPVICDPLALGYLVAARPSSPVSELTTAMLMLRARRVLGCEGPVAWDSDSMYVWAFHVEPGPLPSSRSLLLRAAKLIAVHNRGTLLPCTPARMWACLRTSSPMTVPEWEE